MLDKKLELDYLRFVPVILSCESAWKRKHPTNEGKVIGHLRKKCRDVKFYVSTRVAALLLKSATNSQSYRCILFATTFGKILRRCNIIIFFSLFKIVGCVTVTKIFHRTTKSQHTVTRHDFIQGSCKISSYKLVVRDGKFR